MMASIFIKEEESLAGRVLFTFLFFFDPGVDILLGSSLSRFSSNLVIFNFKKFEFGVIQYTFFLPEKLKKVLININID